VQLTVSPEMAALLERATALSVGQGNFYVGVEHVFTALLENPEKLPRAVVDRYLNSLHAAAREVNRRGWRGAVPSVSGEIFYSPRCIAVTNAATRLAQRLGRDAAGAGHWLLAVLSDPLSGPSRAMDGLQLGRRECGGLLRAELSQLPEFVPEARPPSDHRELPGPEQAAAKPKSGLASLTRDLTAAAAQGEIAPAIGRAQEMFEILQIMARKTKNNVMIVGEAGVGKTQLVEGVAVKIAGGETQGLLPPYRILELNMAALLAGTQYRGAFEEKMLALIEELRHARDTILFIDEAHLIMGAGATEGDSMDVANLLKPVLARGEIRCIGATTLQEYRKCVEKDPAIERRFQMLRVEQLSEEASIEVLQHLKPKFERHHGVHISNRAIQAAVTLTVRHMPNRQLPDKAIDVLDQACARYRLRAIAASQSQLHAEQLLGQRPDGKITPHDIRKVISQITRIPLEELTREERLRLTELERWLKERLIGQDEAVTRAVAAVKKSRAGLADPNRPDAVMLFLGPTGVGKTRLAKLMADALFGSADHLITFDMSEYVEEHSVSRLLGAPPGYAGCEEEGRLTGAVRTTPFSILLLDEIEKAHPRIFDIFLPVFEEGRLKDTRGREVSFRNTIIIMTSNVGASVLCRGGNDSARLTLLEELRRHFRPEFINRIDEIVPFHPLLSEDIRSVLRLEINELRKRLKERNIGVRMYQRAYEHLAELGNCAESGARELRRVVDEYITSPISAMLLEDRFQAGDMIDVLMDDEGALAFRMGAPSRGAQEKNA